MDKNEQIVTTQPEPEVSIDERTGRRIVPTGVNLLSGLVHTSFEPIEAANVIIPYDQ